MNSTLIARGGVPINLDRERIVFFTMHSTWLLVQKYGMHFITALYKADENAEGTSVELKDIDALVFFLWAGLQAEATELKESLPLSRVEEFITPYSLPNVFTAVVTALMRDVEVPALPGKAEAAASSPDRAAKKRLGPTKVSTLMKRSASRSRRSAGR